MPQHIPVEASETLVFTPQSLADLPDAPAFTLRACTRRDKRFQRRLYSELGLSQHSTEAIRAEVMAGYEAISPDESAEHAEKVKAYWKERDEFALQQKDDPTLVWEYDQDIERAVDDLVRKVARSWPTLGAMIADNVEFGEMSDPIQVAVVVTGWSGVDFKVNRKVDRGYTTVECAEDLRDALADFESENKLTPGRAWNELALACYARMHLSEDEAKNFVSPSPSPLSPPPSEEAKTSDSGGKSPASARSKKIPQSA